MQQKFIAISVLLTASPIFFLGVLNLFVIVVSIVEVGNSGVAWDLVFDELVKSFGLMCLGVITAAAIIYMSDK